MKFGSKVGRTSLSSAPLPACSCPELTLKTPNQSIFRSRNDDAMDEETVRYLQTLSEISGNRLLSSGASALASRRLVDSPSVSSFQKFTGQTNPLTLGSVLPPFPAANGLQRIKPWPGMDHPAANPPSCAVLDDGDVCPLLKDSGREPPRRSTGNADLLPDAIQKLPGTDLKSPETDLTSRLQSKPHVNKISSDALTADTCSPSDDIPETITVQGTENSWLSKRISTMPLAISLAMDHNTQSPSVENRLHCLPLARPPAVKQTAKKK